MKIEDQVLTIEQAKHLQDLGLDMSDAAMAWIMKNHRQGYYIDFNQGRIYYQDLIPTYTLQEMRDKLSKEIVEGGKAFHFYIDYSNDEMCEVGYECCYQGLHRVFEEKYFDAVFHLLCWVLENGYLKEETR